LLKILIVGLGNPILGDDGVGWRVAERLQARLPASLPTAAGIQVEIVTLSLGGLSLMEHLIGYTHVIIIDALNSGQKPPGAVTVCTLDELPNRAVGHLSSAHDTSLQNALQVGRSLDAKLPEKIYIVGIESPFVYDFSEHLSPPATAALPQAEQQVIDLLEKWMQASICP
jgi:hydrogenase maturation protease